VVVVVPPPPSRQRWGVGPVVEKHAAAFNLHGASATDATIFDVQALFADLA
jgi:hypothetical protein